MPIGIAVITEAALNVDSNFLQNAVNLFSSDSIYTELSKGNI